MISLIVLALLLQGSAAARGGFEPPTLLPENPTAVYMTEMAHQMRAVQEKYASTHRQVWEEENRSLLSSIKLTLTDSEGYELNVCMTDAFKDLAPQCADYELQMLAAVRIANCLLKRNGKPALKCSKVGKGCFTMQDEAAMTPGDFWQLAAFFHAKDNVLMHCTQFTCHVRMWNDLMQLRNMSNDLDAAKREVAACLGRMRESDTLLRANTSKLVAEVSALDQRAAILAATLADKEVYAREAQAAFANASKTALQCSYDLGKLAASLDDKNSQIEHLRADAALLRGDIERLNAWLATAENQLGRTKLRWETVSAINEHAKDCVRSTAGALLMAVELAGLRKCLGDGHFAWVFGTLVTSTNFKHWSELTLAMATLVVAAVATYTLSKLNLLRYACAYYLSGNTQAGVPTLLVNHFANTDHHVHADQEPLPLQPRQPLQPAVESQPEITGRPVRISRRTPLKY